MSDEQETRLETALQRAADHPAERPEFYRTLMASSLYVLGTSGGEAVDDHVDLKAGDHISIHHWEKPDGTTLSRCSALLLPCSVPSRSKANT
ncbi:SseB family protein [Lelliottia amnigena]|nr:SseB family protein [Lelliottia amnigena]USR62230.1 SseB family protein [Lelliottia amnigena]